MNISIDVEKIIYSNPDPLLVKPNAGFDQR